LTKINYLDYKTELSQGLVFDNCDYDEYCEGDDDDDCSSSAAVAVVVVD